MIPNRYPSTCVACHNPVAERQGFWLNKDEALTSGVYCQRHANPEPQVTTPTTPVQEELMPYDAEPTPTTAQTMQVDQAMMTKAVADIAKLTSEHFLATVPGMVKTTLESLAPRELHVKVNAAPKVVIKQSHPMLATILQAVACGCSPFLVGPAGSGKTTLAEQVAQAMGLKFYMAARVSSDFKLIGFITPGTGKLVRTPFREAFENGGVFLFDEVDASDPDALTAFNAPLANGVCDFPDGMIKRHKDFYAIAAGNTYGRGADRQYVGRNQLDAATLDRFQVFDIDYDETLELTLAGDADWTKYVQNVRRAIEAEKIRHIVSPRAAIRGAAMLAGGMDRRTVEQACVWKGLPEDSKARVISRMVY